MSRITRLVFIQPVITAYRIPLFRDLSERLNGEFSVYADMPSKDFGVNDCAGFGFSQIHWRRIGPLLMFSVWEFFRMWRRGSHFIHYADFKCLSLWLLLLMRLFTSKKVFLHGQGGYKKKGGIATLVYSLAVAMSSGYIAYTQWSAEALKRRLPVALRDKVSYVNNSLYLDPVESPPPASARDILFIGRLREGSNIEMLLQAADELDLKVHVIGAGKPDYERELKEKYPAHVYYGAVYDWDKQKAISKNCYVGVYPGDAGLSVVSYLALGLPVVVHNDIESHMGPEPSYIDNYTGSYFERGNLRSLCEAIAGINRCGGIYSLEKFKKVSGNVMALHFREIVAI